MAGYRNSGARAIRVDMLERLADQLRSEDSRGGFEAKADMLSITGMTLEQFADLMQGLGYRFVRGERVKVKAKPVDPAAVDLTASVAADAETTPNGSEALGQAPVEGATETTNSGATDGGTLAEDGARLEGASAKKSAKEKETQGSIETATQTGNEAETAPETSPAVAAVVAIENAEASTASEVALAKTDNRTIENADTDPAVTETAAVAVTEVVAESVVETATETGTETGTESAAETEAAPDMEVFFTFTWGRNRSQSKPKGQGRRFSDGPVKEAASNTGDTAKNDGRSGSNSRKGRRNKPDGEQAAQDRAGLKKSGQSRQTTPGQQTTGRDKFNRDKDRKPGKGKFRHNGGPKQFAASPKKSQQIDPDNPFAAALMGLKDKI